jgi:hypothetical protein
VNTAALRILAGAGVLAAGLLIGSPCVVPALAQNGDAIDSDTGADGSSASGGSGLQSAPEVGGDESASHGDAGARGRPISTIGDGRNNVVHPNGPIVRGDGRPASKYTSLLIPILRIPTVREFAAPGWTPPSAYVTTLEVPVISLNDILSALAAPKPKPAPGPAFRTGQEAPVIDAAPGPGGNHSEPMAAIADAPKPYEVPLVAAPRILSPPQLEPVAKAAQPTSGTAATTPLPALGAGTPVIRGASPPPGQSVTAPRSFTALSGQSAREAYPRYLRPPTMAELSLVALPGVAGLLVLTAGGGVIGYRQANSARFIRGMAAARFLE